MFSMVMAPASILEKSRMSLMMASRFCPEFSMVRTKSRCSSSSFVSRSRFAKPSTPFMGVRIS